MKIRSLIVGSLALGLFGALGSTEAQAKAKWHTGIPTALRGKWRTKAISYMGADVQKIPASRLRVTFTKKKGHVLLPNDHHYIIRPKWRKTGRTYIVRGQIKHYGKTGNLKFKLSNAKHLAFTWAGQAIVGRDVMGNLVRSYARY